MLAPNASETFFADLEKAFSVTLADSREIINNFHSEMRAGLAGEKSSLKMIPSFVSRPTGAEKGKHLVLDLGGTNLRILAVELDGHGNSALAAVSRFVVPHPAMCGTGEGLFDFIAECIQNFLEENSINSEKALKLAFTFSFPIEQSSIASGKLIEWTKGFTATGVAGRDVMLLLSEALERKGLGFIGLAALANDTVGTLVAKAYSDSSCDMGVILGTGTNACYPEKVEKIVKLRNPALSGEMIVNMEWGGFNRLKMNVYDEKLDSTSHNAGMQKLEKMVSGMYLGEIARLVIVDLISQGLLFSKGAAAAFEKENILRTEHLSQFAGGVDFFEELGLKDVSTAESETVRQICRMIAVRSARIAGSAIAAVIVWMDPELAADHTVAVDGSLFEKYPGYREDICDLFQELFGDRGKKINLEMISDGSGIGSAIIGAVAASAAE